MKNTNRPTNEDFVLTKKKMRMIYGMMHTFYMSNLCEAQFYPDFVPEVKYFIEFVKQRLLFLENVKCTFGIETMKNENGIAWTGLYFMWQGEVIRYETERRKEFLPQS